LGSEKLKVAQFEVLVLKLFITSFNFLHYPFHSVLQIVHNYGHGGYGVTLAPGTALHAVRLVTEALAGNMANPPAVASKL
jgi:hypothetical protein